MNVRATAKFIGTSPRKVGLVAALIRGRRAHDAQTVLLNTQKRATDPVGKVLASAIANAENNFNLKANNLVIESVLVGPAPTLKRFRARAQGRAASIRKRSSHITVVLSDASAPSTDKPAPSNPAKASGDSRLKAQPADSAESTNKEAK